MVRFLVLSLTVLLTALAAPAFAQAASINVNGKLANGAYVQAVCSVGADGTISGTGVLFGTNPSNGYKYSYAFVIKSGSTASGKLVLSGNFAFAGGYPVTLSASIPNGPLTFTYIVNGSSYTTNGVGIVSVK